MYFLMAAKPILRDLMSSLVFVGLFWLTGNIFLATAVGIVLGIVQTLWMRMRAHPIGPLQWLSIVLVTVLGTTTILTHNPHFIMVKPTLLWLALGAVMLRRDWMAPYLPSIVTENLEDRLIVRAGYAWALLMLVLAVMNLLVAFTMSPRFWSVYAVFVPAASFIVLFATQYFMFRKHVIEKIRARAEAQTA